MPEVNAGGSLIVSDSRIDGPHGPTPIRVYRAADETEPIGGLVWLHGGGFMAGDLDMPESDWVAREIAEAGIVVVTVDYRLAPVPDAMAAHLTPRGDTAVFPIASEEAEAVLVWARDDPGLAPHVPWVIGGASAGGNLAAGVTLRLRDRGAPPAGLLLAYPLLHKALPPMRAELQSKYEQLALHVRLSPETIDVLNRNYVGDAGHLDDPYAFPGGHAVEGMPTTLVVTSDRDSLRASGEAFAAQLAADGVNVTLVREPETEHGHLNQPDNVGAQRSIRRMIDWLQREAGGVR